MSGFVIVPPGKYMINMQSTGILKLPSPCAILDSAFRGRIYHEILNPGEVSSIPADCESVRIHDSVFIFVPKDKLRERTCYAADCKEYTNLRCSRCCCAYYCSPECQIKEWQKHKSECKPLREADNFIKIPPILGGGKGMILAYLPSGKWINP